MHCRPVFHLFAAILAGGVSTFSYAQPEPKEAPFPVLVADAPDNSAGFAVFRKQLPPLPADPVPVRILFRNGAQVSHSSNEFPPNAWAGLNAEGAKVVVTPTRSFTEDVLVLEPSKGGWNMRGNPSDYHVVAQEVDPLPELREAFETLRTDDRSNRYKRRRLLERPGELMLFAVRLHAWGHEDKANQLAAYLFEHLGKKKALFAGLSAIADSAYQDLLDTFEQNRNPAALLAAAEQLLEERGRYWISSPQLKEKLPEWKTAMDMAPTDLPSIEGVELTPEQKDLYARLVADPEALYTLAIAFRHENWLLQPHSLLNQRLRYIRTAAEGDAGSEGAKKLVYAIHALGAKALPLFRVMLEDPRFLPKMEGGLRQYQPNQTSRSSNDQPVLPEPTLMRDLARDILYPLAPADDNWHGRDAQTLAGDLQIFHSLIKDMDRFQLAQLYLDRRNEYNLPEEAVYTLLSSPDASHRQRILQLASQPGRHVRRLADMLLEYAAHRPEEAKPALREMKEMIPQHDPNDLGLYGDKTRQQELLKKIDLALDEQPENEPPPDLSTQLDAWIEADDPSNNLGMMNVLEAVKHTPETEIQGLFAKKINEQPVGVSLHLFNLFSRIQSMGGASAVDQYTTRGHRDQLKFYLEPELEPEDPADSTTDATIATWDTALWEPFLQPDDKAESHLLAKYISIQLIYHALARQEDREDAGWFYYLTNGPLEGPIHEQVLAWGRAALRDPSGDWVDEIPKADSLPETRQTEILHLLKGENPAKTVELLQSATLAERWFIVDQVEEDTPLLPTEVRKALIPHRTLVSTVVSPEKNPVLSTIQPGDAVDFDLINRLLEEARRLALAGEKGVFHLEFLPFQQGVAIQHQTRFLHPHYTRENPVRIQIHTGREQGSAGVSTEAPLVLSPPDGNATENKPNNLLELMEGTGDNPGTEVSAVLHAWLTKPLGLVDSSGNLLIAYNGTLDKEEN